MVSYGCLLHDIGKVVFRAGENTGTHSEAGYSYIKSVWNGNDIQAILSSIRYHHADALRRANISDRDIAYIAYHADNISAAADRRSQDSEQQSFDRYLPLSPVFRHLNGERRNSSLSPAPLDGKLRMPLDANKRITAEEYQNILREISNGLRAVEIEQSWLNSLLSLLEAWTSTIPSSTNLGESPDVSLFDHMKISAAAGACISEYLMDRNITDYRNELFVHEAEFKKEQAYILYSADFSGIQNFIYTVATANALRSLRSRSFFLELLMEHYIDEILSGCGVSRANLLYSGGGHCYMLLPNTEHVKSVLKEKNEFCNDWLIDQFGARLYLADGWSECSGNDLTNYPAAEAPYQKLFRRVSTAVSEKKLHRYSVRQLIRLNSGRVHEAGRECTVCGQNDNLGKENLCKWCELFEGLSRKIQQDDIIYVTSDSTTSYDFELPWKAYFSFLDVDSARKRLSSDTETIRVYTKNHLYTGLKYSTRLFVGDYSSSNSMEEFSQVSEGIPRIGVCRMDVDNLGQAFVSGFEQKNTNVPEERQKYVTISRTSAFSRQMSLFFKSYINPILSGDFMNRGSLNVSIVYSGGDDVFLVGAWNDILESAIRIRSALKEFSCGALTISAGIGIFQDHYPIRAAAEKTAVLEEKAKSLPGKDGIALFEEEVYQWDVFRTTVYGEMLQLLMRFFDSESNERGSSFLYRIVNLLRGVEDRINLARYAYLLARLEPGPSDPAFPLYKEFSSKLYDWGLKESTRKQLITAIYIYTYLNRGRK